MLYQVIQPMTLHPGALLGLTAEQAQVRAYALAPEGLRWRAIKPVGFKAGEQVELEQLPKALAHALRPVEAAGQAEAGVKRSPRKRAEA